MIKFVGMLKRPADMSLEELKKWWLGDHAKLTRETFPGLRKYIISLAIGPYTKADLKLAGREKEGIADGMPEMWFDSVESLHAGIDSSTMTALKKDAADHKIDLGVEMWTDEYPQQLPHAKEPIPDMIKFVSCLKRPPKMSVDDLKKWWLGDHAKYTREKFPGLRKYVVTLAFGPRGDQIAWCNKGVECEADGMATMWFDNLDALKKGLASPEMAHLKKDAADHSITEVLQMWTKEYPQPITRKS